MDNNDHGQRQSKCQKKQWNLPKHAHTALVASSIAQGMIMLKWTPPNVLGQLPMA